jgi:hypothetical protein
MVLVKLDIYVPKDVKCILDVPKIVGQLLTAKQNVRTYNFQTFWSLEKFDISNLLMYAVSQ